MSDALGIAVIGAGFIGKVHARCINDNPRTRISAVYDIDADLAGQLAARYSARHAASWKKQSAMPMWPSSAPPRSRMARSRGSASKTGRHFCARSPSIRRCSRPWSPLAWQERPGCSRAWDCNRRFDAEYQALHQAVGNGDLGKVEIVLMTSRTQSLPSLEYVAKSGGQLRDKGAHWFDLLCWLTRERPKEIFVHGNCLIDKRFADHGDVDTAAISIEMESGALCQMNFSRRTAYGYDERVEIAGSDGMMQACPPIPVNVKHFRGNNITQGGVHADWYSRIQGTYPAQLEALVDAIDGKGEFPTLVDGLVAEAIAMAGNQSLELKKPVCIMYDFDLR